MHDPVDDIKVSVRCPDCRITFRERVKRIVHGDRIVCPGCHEEMSFSGIDHHHAGEDVTRFIHRVEQRTRHPF